MSQQVQNSHSQFPFKAKKLRSSYQGTKNVATYAFSSGKILDVRQIAGVKDMTNIMSDWNTNILTKQDIFEIQGACPEKKIISEMPL